VPLTEQLSEETKSEWNGLWVIEWSPDRCYHVTIKGQGRDSNGLNILKPAGDAI